MEHGNPSLFLGASLLPISVSLLYRENTWVRRDCRRNRSGQTTLEQPKATMFNDMAATGSIQSSYFHSNSTEFNKRWNLVRDHGLHLL